MIILLLMFGSCSGQLQFRNACQRAECFEPTVAVAVRARSEDLETLIQLGGVVVASMSPVEVVDELEIEHKLGALVAQRGGTHYVLHRNEVSWVIKVPWRQLDELPSRLRPSTTAPSHEPHGLELKTP